MKLNVAKFLKITFAIYLVTIIKGSKSLKELKGIT